MKMTQREYDAKFFSRLGVQPTGRQIYKWDPDGDGDDDSTPEGDTDHSHWTVDGKQKKAVPGKPLPKK